MRIFWIMTVLLLTGCSTTVTGPITGRGYNLEIGCTDNMQAYTREREAEASTTSETAPPAAKIDCPIAPDPQP